ncbi:hypothetical protein ACWGH8_25875, partial [Nonomuraea muscovyensis]
PVDRVAAQAFSAFEKAGVVTVPKETGLTEPIGIAVHGEGGTAFGHQVIEIGAFAEAVVVGGGPAGARGGRGGGPPPPAPGPGPRPPPPPTARAWAVAIAPVPTIAAR